MKNQDLVRDAELIPVSGTLDAVAMYMEKEFGFSSDDSNKVVKLLWLEQECDLAEAARMHELNGSLNSDGNLKAEGMVFNSRIAFNLEKTKADALRKIPLEFVEHLLSTEGLAVKTVKMLIKIVCIIAPSTTFVQDGLACVCMRAWNYVKRREHIPFQVKNVMSDRELPQDTNSCRVCDLTEDNGRQHMGNATWECPCHKDQNYCTLTNDSAREMLDCLVEQRILENLGNESYAFL